MIADELAMLIEDARDRVSRGLAVHIDQSMVIELEIIAGLAWNQRPTATLDALAYGWLKLAHVPVWTSDIDGGTFSRIDNRQITGEHTARAAAYAELAVAAARLNRSRGTLETATAAWDFIANGKLSVEQAIPILRKLEMKSFHEFVAIAIPMADHYRRELIQLRGERIEETTDP